MGTDPQLAPIGNDVIRVGIVVTSDYDPIRHWRRGELGHLFPEFADVVAGLAEGELQFFVLGRQTRDVTLGVEQPLLDRGILPRTALVRCHRCLRSVCPRSQTTERRRTRPMPACLLSRRFGVYSVWSLKAIRKGSYEGLD